MAKTAAASTATRPSARRVWRGPTKATPLTEEDQLANWIEQTVRNMQALGYGHQRGVPCLVTQRNEVLLQRAGPHTDCTPEDWLKISVQALGSQIAGAGYIYWNGIPEGLREAVR